MKITKYGHCCLLIEENGVRVLTDPGSYTTAQNDIKNIDVVLITHEHGDHLHIESMKKILENNPGVEIITNNSVDKLLREAGVIGAIIVSDKDFLNFRGIRFEGHGTIHEIIHSEWPRVENTGYKINDKLFYPGDSFEHKNIDVDVLALPVSGPWVKISDAIDYCIRLKPKKYFAVHDGGLNENGHGFNKRVAPVILKNHNIEFVDLEIGKETEF